LPLFAQNCTNFILFPFLLSKTWQTKNPSISREAGIICLIYYPCFILSDFLKKHKMLNKNPKQNKIEATHLLS